MDKRIEKLQEKIDKINAENLALVTTIGGRIRKARKENGLTQQDLAEALSIERTSIANIELNKRMLSSDKIIAICNLFKLSADYLLGIHHINGLVLGMPPPVGNGYGEQTQPKQSCEQS